MLDWSKIEQKISGSAGKHFELKNHTAIGGGDTNAAYQLDGFLDGHEAARFFIKLNQKSRLDMFEAEAAGLQEIEKSQTIRVPHVIDSGVLDDQSYLILEYLSFASGNAGSAKQLGQQLALMHQYTSAEFGWSRNNTIGTTAQMNIIANSWVDFWREQRLGFQLALAKKKGASESLFKKGEKVLANLDVFFASYQPKASLLHGDLWAGNYGYLESGSPVIFDPAIYYGDREADIAMTELFGGYPSDFYSGYNVAWPLDDGYQYRKILYNLYHILNHYNLFGGGYAGQAENMLDKLVSEFSL